MSERTPTTNMEMVESVSKLFSAQIKKNHELKLNISRVLVEIKLANEIYNSKIQKGTTSKYVGTILGFGGIFMHSIFTFGLSAVAFIGLGIGINNKAWSELEDLFSQEDSKLKNDIRYWCFYYGNNKITMDQIRDIIKNILSEKGQLCIIPETPNVISLDKLETDNKGINCFTDFPNFLCGWEKEKNTERTEAPENRLINQVENFVRKLDSHIEEIEIVKNAVRKEMARFDDNDFKIFFSKMRERPMQIEDYVII